MKFYEVKKYGVTIEMSSSLKDAEERFKKAQDGDVQMYRITNGVKFLIKTK